MAGVENMTHRFRGRWSVSLGGGGEIMLGKDL